MTEIYINGQAYSSNNVQFVFLGVPLRSVRMFNHGIAKDSEALFAHGSPDAVAYGEGKNNVSWSFEALESELKAIRSTFTGGNFTDVAPGTISCILLNGSAGQETTKLFGCKCTSDALSSQSSDKGIYAAISGFAVGRKITT